MSRKTDVHLFENHSIKENVYYSREHRYICSCSAVGVPAENKLGLSVFVWAENNKTNVLWFLDKRRPETI